MKKKNLIKVFLFIAFISVTSVNVFAQEFEVTTDRIYMRSYGTNGSLFFYPSGSLCLSTSSSDAFTINVNSSSKRGLVVRNNWSSPAAFEVYGNGNILANGLALYSDSTLKENIQPLGSQLEKFTKLKGVSYYWKKKAKGNKKNYGLLAQEVAKIYPEMVFEADSGQLAIYYTELIPVLIQVTQEQQTVIEAQAQQLLAIEKRLLFLEKKNK